MPREKETSNIRSLGNGDKSSVPLDSAGTRERPEIPIAAPSTCRQAAENVPRGIFSEELRKMAARAKFNRYIPIEALIRILAQEEDYTKLYAEALPVLWSNYGLDAIWRKKGKKELEIVTFGNRYEIWEGVLLRWTGISILGGKFDMEPPYLNIYQFIPAKGTYEKAFYPGSGGLYYINLEEFRAYLQLVQNMLEIHLPLPKILYAEDDGDGEGVKFEEVESGDSVEKRPESGRVSAALPPEFVFKKTAGGGWQIVFHGEFIGPLKGKGFDFMHFCIRNAPKAFTNTELENAINFKTGISGESRQVRLDRNSDSKVGEEYHEGFQVGGLKAISGKKQELTDMKALAAVYKELQDKKAELEKARDEGNTIEADFLERDVNRIEEEIDGLSFKGKFKYFRDDVNRVSDRVNRAIGRAIDLLTPNPEAYEHFKKAFNPIHSNSHRYNSPERINWILE